MKLQTWGSIEEDPSWGNNVETLKELRVDEGQEHHLLQGFDVLLQAANLVEGDCRVNLHIEPPLSNAVQRNKWSVRLA